MITLHRFQTLAADNADNVLLGLEQRLAIHVPDSLGYAIQGVGKPQRPMSQARNRQSLCTGVAGSMGSNEVEKSHDAGLRRLGLPDPLRRLSVGFTHLDHRGLIFSLEKRRFDEAHASDSCSQPLFQAHGDQPTEGIANDVQPITTSSVQYRFDVGYDLFQSEAALLAIGMAGLSHPSQVRNDDVLPRIEMTEHRLPCRLTGDPCTMEQQQRSLTALPVAVQMTPGYALVPTFESSLFEAIIGMHRQIPVIGVRRSLALSRPPGGRTNATAPPRMSRLSKESHCMTSKPVITPLPYHADPLERFARLRHREGAVLLDSGRPEGPGGRYDILASDPIAILEVDTHGKVHCDRVPSLPEDPFAAQQALLESFDVELPDSDLPFLGGLIGYWSYDLGRRLETLPNRAQAAATLPWSRLGLYDWALIQDHLRREAWLVATPERRRQVDAWLTRTPPAPASFNVKTPFRAEMDQASYAERFQAIQRYIQAGDCYQINLAQRFSAPYQGDVWEGYLALRRATPTPFAGFMAWDDKAVLSMSPERFLQVREGQVETRPIKGTRPRGMTAEEDARLATELSASPKDRAENVMIVDLLRNDLGRVCRPGSVRVPQLCGLESYANVHHLVSVVTGELASSYSPIDLLAAAFPGGSITGAPKIRAMQIIDELEPSRRSVYCGSLGYIDPRGAMDTSIAIRTVIADGGQLHVWGGGGLVSDSSAEEEYQESLAKITRLMDALSTA